MLYANYLPDELLLEILGYMKQWEKRERQLSLAAFCAANRQWYE
jgi:hypothetical protein